MILNRYKLVLADPGEPVDDADGTKYRSLIGMLLFSAQCLPYDICLLLG